MIKPCPFCGGEPHLTTLGSSEGYDHGGAIHCTNCAVETPLGDTSQEAIDAWNSRDDKSRWISVNYYLPDRSSKDLFMCAILEDGERSFSICRISEDYDNDEFFWLNDYWGDMTVTHWMAIPELPK